MRNKIAIRREDLSKKGEKRVAISPELAKKILANGNELSLQPAIHPTEGTEKRAFTDSDYQNVGVEIAEEISEADVIFGLKEVDLDHILPEKTYLFFSHTHKGQIKNRKLLKTLMDRKCTVIDYELIVDEEKQRIVTAFTYFAGYAGMVDSLWTLGKRWKEAGIDSPFAKVPQSVASGGLYEARKIVTQVGQEISEKGTPESQPPMICAFLGNGKTSTGAQEIFDLMPGKEIQKYELKDVFNHENRNQVYKVVLDIPDMFRFKSDSPYKNQNLSFSEIFNLYLKEPDHFESAMDEVFPYITMLMNCIIWSPKYPRLLTYENTTEFWAKDQHLQVVGDITCDPEGAIQFSRETWIDNPTFIYNPETREITYGTDGNGIAVMAVTNLPCEFPVDASSQFSRDIEALIPGIIDGNYQAESYKAAGLPKAIEGATILWRGKLTDDFQYMAEYVKGI